MTSAESTAVTLESSSGVPPMRFVAPEGFHALPVDASLEEMAERAAGFVHELYPNGDEELWTPAAEYYAAMASAVAEAGVAYSALGLFAIDEGVAHCSFTVAAVESGHTDPEIVAHGVRAILENDPLNDVRWVDLPCGPAVACISVREMTLPPDLTASGEETKLRTGQIQVHVPFPTGPYTAILTLDTMALEQWGDFCEMMITILRTISFTDSPAGPDDAS